MAKLYRSLGRKTVRVTVEVPVSVVAVLVASARANGSLGANVSSEPFVPQLLALEICESASLMTDYVENEGNGLRCFSVHYSDNDDGVALSQHLYDVLPEVRGAGVGRGVLRPWWLRPGKGAKSKRR